MRWLRPVCCAATVAVALAASQAPADEAPPAGRLGQAVVPVSYRIELAIDPSQAHFSGQVQIDVVLAEPRDAIWLHGRNLEISEAYVTDRDSRRIDAAYSERLDSGVARLQLSRTAPAGPAVLHLSYRAPFNAGANALYRIERNGLHYAITQFEPIGARQVFPGFDEPGFKVPFDLSVIARRGDVVVTTTPEIRAEDQGDGLVRHEFARTRPLPTYLLAFAVGPYDIADIGPLPPNAVRKRELPLRGIAAKGQGGKLHYALANTNGLLTALETYFGTPYPYQKLDLIAVPENFGGAMENVGAITYDEYLLLMDVDAPLDQRRAYAAVHAHEMSHMWFGNLVTPAWWNDIWLNESFASWMQNKAAQSYWPAGEFDRSTLQGALGAMASDSLAAAREIREPIERNEQISSAFDGITYQKGAGVLAMLERYVGEERFRDGIRLHQQLHQDGTATAEDFIAAVARGSNHAEIESAFRSFISQPGVPLVTARLDCSDRSAPRLEVRQGRYAPLGSAIKPDANRWDIPFCAAFTVAGERHDHCAMLAEPQQTVALGVAGCPTDLHPNADGAGYYRFNLDEAGWRALIERAPRLDPREALTLADSLDASFRSGGVPAELYVAGMASLMTHPAWDVVGAVTGKLEQITEILDEAQLRRAERAFRAMAGPRYARLGADDEPGVVLLRKDLQRFLIVIAKDQVLRKPLAEQAAAVLGFGRPADPAAAPAEEYETILSVGVQDLGKGYFDLLMTRALESDVPAFRNAALGAVARAEDPAMVRELQAAILAGKLKGTEMLGVLFRQLYRRATSEATYAWLRANDDAIIAMIPETFRANVVPGLGGAFCTGPRAAEWREFVLSHANALPGYERDLAQAIESIELCAALRQAGAESLASAFDRRGT
jgi:alanyl aminopeptidase